MAASEGIAKRASIGISFSDTDFINNMERFNRLLKGSNDLISRFHGALDRTDQSLSSLDQHMSMFADRHGETMDRINQHNNSVKHSTEQLSESERSRYQNEIKDLRKNEQVLSHDATVNRRNAEDMEKYASNIKSKMNDVGDASEHSSSRVVSATGRTAHGFERANRSIQDHANSIRRAQSSAHFWLRTAQDMSGATLGLGAAFYKGAKDATTLQQSYIHAGNMAHYGGEKISQVQHDINHQWKTGANLSVRYGVSQDQIAKGYQALVARGYTTNESLHTQKSLLQAAIASGDNYNDVVKDSTNVLDAYNMRSQNAATMTDNTRKVVNEMAYAADQTATNFQGLGIGMSYVAATAHTTHQSISQTSSALGILSNKGMQASQAGVGLRKVLNSFLSINKKGQQAQAMQQMGLTENDFKTASGHLKSLGSLMSLLNEKTSRMDSQERGAIFHRFFGATGQEAGLNLASDTQGLSQLNDQVERSQNMGKNHQGYVALLSAHNMKSAQNQINKFKMAWQAFTITSARELLPQLTGILKHLDRLIDDMDKLSPRTRKMITYGALAVAAIAPISAAIYGVVSAVNGLRYTWTKLREVMDRPMPTTATDSMNDQSDQLDSDATGSNVSHVSPITGTSGITRLSAQWSNSGLLGKATVAGLGADIGWNAVSAIHEGLGTKRGSNDMWQAGGKAVGAGIGFYLGGPMGAAAGTAIGGAAAKALNSKTAHHYYHEAGNDLNNSHYGHMVNNNKVGMDYGTPYGDVTNETQSELAEDERRAYGNIKVARRLAAEGTMSNGEANYRMINDANRFSNEDKQIVDSTGKTNSDYIHEITHLETQSNYALAKSSNRSYQKITDNYNKLFDVARDYSNSRLNHDKKSYQLLEKNGLINAQTAKNSLNIQTNDDKFHLHELSDDENKLQRIEEHGGKDRFAAIKQLNSQILALTHINGKKQLAIRNMLSDHERRLSSYQYGKIIDYANKARSTTDSSAKDRYNNAVEYAQKRYSLEAKAANNLKGISTFQRNQVINNALKQERRSINNASAQYHGTLYWASKQHRDVVEQAKEEAGDAADAFSSSALNMKSVMNGMFDATAKPKHSLTYNTTHPMNNGYSAKPARTGAQKMFADEINSYAIGGAITHNQSALIGERGLESVYNPMKSTLSIVGRNGPQVIRLMTGDRVLNNFDTRKLFSNGLGAGIRLPGYVNGRGNRIAVGINHNVDPSQMNSLTGDVEKVIPKGDDFHDTVTKDTGYLGDAFNAYNVIHGPIKGIGHRTTDLLGDIGFSKAGAWLGAKIPGPAPTKAMGSVFGAFGGGKLINRFRNHFPRFSHYLNQAQGSWFMPKNFKSMEKEYAHSGIGKFLSPKGMKHHITAIKHLGRNFGSNVSHLGHDIARRSGQAWRGAKRMGRHALRGLRSFGSSALRRTKRIGSSAWRGIKRFGRGTMHFGRRMFRSGRRLLDHAGHGIARFSRRTWSSAKRLGRRLWTGTKHVARRLWTSAKRTGSNIWHSTRHIGRNVWNDSKRVARNVGRSAARLWNRTKRGASRTWSVVERGVGRMASRVKQVGSHAWSAIKSGAETAKNVAERAMGTIISWAHKAAHAVHWALTLGGHLGHHASGGRITHNELSLVGERGPEAAYNARTGSIRMLGLNGPQIAELIAGESVLTNTQTNRLLHGGLGRGTRLPAYAHGTNARLSGPASRSSVFSIIGTFHGKQALSNMRNFNKHAKAIWDDVSSHITNGSQDMSKSVTKTNSSLSDNTRDIFKDMSKKVNDLTDDLKDGLIQAARDMAEGFGDKFKKLITYAREDMESVIDKLNRGVTGIDHALRAFGGNSHVIHPIHYATGTMNGRIAYDQLGILNDAISGPRQEAILRGNQVLMPQGDNVPVPLQKGDAVLNGDQTKQLINNTTNINHYAKGSGIHINFKHLGQLIKTMGLALKGPAAFFKKTFNHFVGGISGHQLTKGLENTGMEAIKPLGVKWTRAMFSFIHSILSPGGTSASASAFLNYAESHRPHNYIYGGAPGLNDTDCSGFVEACLQHFGISAPRTSGAQIAHFQHISRADARPGDLLGTGEHIGIVADNGAHHYFSNHGPEGHHPAASMTPYVPSAFPGGAASFARVPKLARYNKPKHKKSTPFLERLVKNELGFSAIHWLKSIAPMLSIGSGMNNPGGTSLKRFVPEIEQAAQVMHAHLTPHLLSLLLGTINNESGGRTGASNDYDSNAGANHSVGLLQYTLQTWDNYALPGHKDRTNAYDNFLAFFNNSQYASSLVGYDSANGKSGGEWSPAHGSGPGGSRRFSSVPHAANGGWSSMPAIFGEVPGEPEVAINPARSSADNLIMEAIAARIKDNPSSKMGNLIKSIAIRRKGSRLQTAVSGLLNRANKPSTSNKHKAININISFGNIIVNSNGGNVNTGALVNKIKKAAKQAVMKAAYESATKLD